MCNFYLAGLAQRHLYVHSTKELITRRVVQHPFQGDPPRVFELLKIGSFKFTFSLDFHPTLASLNYFLLTRAAHAYLSQTTAEADCVDYKCVD